MPELISHTIAIGLAIAVVVSLAAVLNVVREQNQSSLAEAMAENVCHQIKLAAEQLSPSSQSSTVQLTLPNKIGGEPYSARASGHTITITSASASHSCVAGTPVQLSGAAYGGTTQLVLSENTIMMSG